MKSKLYLTVNGCSRCGKIHKKRRVHLLRKPSEYTHFYLCPKTNEPSLLKIEITGELDE